MPVDDFINADEDMQEDTSAYAIYGGPRILVEKEPFANHNLEENQDRINANVWLTRADTQGLFNLKNETLYNPSSPSGTEWAKGTTENIGGLVFTDWRTAMEQAPDATIGNDYIIHLIEEDAHSDITILSRSTGRTGGGGGFSYERTTKE